ncbi:MAG TPA: hypothetical protein VL475_08140, partial [Planctomycetaceae bacterium]|nr:hypothetical protein [Planctomycetaceae bacterium]
LLLHARQRHRAGFYFKVALATACGALSMLVYEAHVRTNFGLVATAWGAAAIGMIAVLELICYRFRSEARFNRLGSALQKSVDRAVGNSHSAVSRRPAFTAAIREDAWAHRTTAAQVEMGAACG